MKRRNRWIVLFIVVALMASLFPTVAFADPGDIIVYRTENGKRYHTESHYSDSSYAVTLEEALASGLTPCGVCHPPEIDHEFTGEDSSASDILATSVFVDGTKFKVTITYTNTIPNSKVGHTWIYKFYINGYVIVSEDIVAFNQDDTLAIHTIIIENDKIPDEGTAETTYALTKKDLSDGFTVAQDIEVMENAGRYAGDTTIWTVEYTFTRCD